MISVRLVLPGVQMNKGIQTGGRTWQLECSQGSGSSSRSVGFVRVGGSLTVTSGPDE